VNLKPKCNRFALGKVFRQHKGGANRRFGSAKPCKRSFPTFRAVQYRPRRHPGTWLRILGSASHGSERGVHSRFSAPSMSSLSSPYNVLSYKKGNLQTAGASFSGPHQDPTTSRGQFGYSLSRLTPFPRFCPGLSDSSVHGDSEDGLERGERHRFADDVLFGFGFEERRSVVGCWRSVSRTFSSRADFRSGLSALS
jgi:hypothetical protein